jgi:hypothetical protein
MPEKRKSNDVTLMLSGTKLGLGLYQAWFHFNPGLVLSHIKLGFASYQA